MEDVIRAADARPGSASTAGEAKVIIRQMDDVMLATAAGALESTMQAVINALVSRTPRA